MYNALNAKSIATMILWSFVVPIVLVLWLGGLPDSLWSLIRLVGLAVSLYLALLFAIFGTSHYWSPWRVIWRFVPALNHWIYPDLNGIWFGSTQSNWPVVRELREAAAGGGGCDLSALSEVELLRGEIALNVRASFFSISIRSRVGQTNADSFSTFAVAEKCGCGPDFTISYIYTQEVPQPQSSDEATHIGAAILEVTPCSPPVMEGHYWTRRKWREGMNTAGLIGVERLSDMHAGPTQNLLEFAKRLKDRPIWE